MGVISMLSFGAFNFPMVTDAMTLALASALGKAAIAYVSLASLKFWRRTLAPASFASANEIAASERTAIGSGRWKRYDVRAR